MPRGDGTGPQGQGPKTGRGMGKCDPQDGTPVPRGQGGMRTGKGQGRGSGQGNGRGGGQGSGKGRGRRS